MPRWADVSGRASTLVSLAVLTLALTMPVQAQRKGEGPASLFLTYDCTPEKRAAFRAHMSGAGVNQFEKWKGEGVYKDYLVLFSSYVNAGEENPDMMVRLDFARYVDTAKWKAVERTTPGGLSAEALALCSPVTAYFADLTWEGTPSPTRNLSKAVYVWIPYHREKGVGSPEYKNYFETYVKPQNEAWLAARALSWWGVYLNQHDTGKPWDILFLYEYADDVGLARRDVVKESSRAKLRGDPAWKALSDKKWTIRTEDQVIIMDPVLPR